MRRCYLALVPVFQRIINLSLSQGEMHEDLKIAMLPPLLKKCNTVSTSFKLEISVQSHPIEKSVSGQLNNYRSDNDIHTKYRSAYKAFYS